MPLLDFKFPVIYLVKIWTFAFSGFRFKGFIFSICYTRAVDGINLRLFAAYHPNCIDAVIC